MAFESSRGIKIYVLGIDFSGVDWGDAPTWITAVATIAALIAAGLAVRASWAVLKLETRREDRAEKADAERRAAAERAEQADYVAAWMHWNDGVPLFPDTTIFGPMMGQGWGALVTNASSLPIYTVALVFYGRDGEERDRVEKDFVPPGESHVPWNKELRQGDGEDRELGTDIRVEIFFRDTAGRTWRRDMNGVLHRTGITVFPEGIDASA
jgi:hypothetical protein